MDNPAGFLMFIFFACPEPVKTFMVSKKQI
jgi:hypothetical protein